MLSSSFFYLFLSELRHRICVQIGNVRESLFFLQRMFGRVTDLHLGAFARHSQYSSCTFSHPTFSVLVLFVFNPGNLHYLWYEFNFNYTR